MALTYVTFGPTPFWASGQYQKAPAGEVKSMLAAEERESSSRGRLDLLLEQLGMTVEWWEEELPAAGVSSRSRGALVEIFSFAGAVLPLFPLLFPLVPPQDVPEGEAGHGEPSSLQAIRRARPWSRPGLTYIPALPPVYDVVAGTSPQTRSRRVSSRCEADNI